jgi:ribonuclease HII
MSWLYDRLVKRDFLSAQEIYDSIGFRTVVGVSLEGSSALAGPLAASAVMLVPEQPVKYNHSIKTLSSEDCNKLSDDIKFRADMASLGWAFESTVQESIRKSVGISLGLISYYNPVTIIVLDGFTLETLPINLERSGIPVVNVKNAHEFFEPTIAAKIVARAARNNLMDELHETYPEYEWDTNKGYATAAHIEAIKKYGITAHHRPLIDVKSLKGVNLFRNIREREDAFNNFGR